MLNRLITYCLEQPALRSLVEERGHREIGYSPDYLTTIILVSLITNFESRLLQEIYYTTSDIL